MSKFVLFGAAILTAILSAALLGASLIALLLRDHFTLVLVCIGLSFVGVAATVIMGYKLRTMGDD